MYLAPDLSIGYQYLSLGHIQISPLVVSHIMHSSFKYDSTLLGHAPFLQPGCFCHRIYLIPGKQLNFLSISHTVFYKGKLGILLMKNIS